MAKKASKKSRVATISEEPVVDQPETEVQPTFKLLMKEIWLKFLPLRSFLSRSRNLVLASVAFLAGMIITLIIIVSVTKPASVHLGTIPVSSSDSLQSVEKSITTAVNRYQVVLQNPDGSTQKFPLKLVGLNVDVKASADKALKASQHSFLRRLTWWRTDDQQLMLNTDHLLYTSFISHYAVKAAKPVRDANLVIKHGKVITVHEKSGEGSSVPDAQNTIYQAVASLSNTPIKFVTGPIKPTLYAKDLESSRSKIEKILASKVVFAISDQSITASAEDVGGWLDLSPVPSAKTIDVNVNSGKVLSYIDRIAKPYVQPPRDRLIVKLDGKEQVIDKGGSGVDVVNKDQAAAQVGKQLIGTTDINIALDVSYAKAKTVEVQTYPKWIIADVSTKRMYAYEKTKLVRTFLVTAGAPLTPTVLGQYKIYSKFVSQNMRGENADGSRYFQPNVPYVNYFYGGYAIHGNYWRPDSYFGNVNSSHGCLGIRPADAAWVYNWAPIGTPVIIHS